MDYKTAKNNLLSGISKNSKWFKENGYLLEYAYALVLEDNTCEALKLLEKIFQFDTRADWLKKIIPIITNSNIEVNPSFSQVKNFLEIDLSIFIKNEKIEYITNILNKKDYFYSLCRESYKFIGRALFYCELKDLAFKFYVEAKKNFYLDPELHYLLALYYYDINDIKLCIKHSKICLEMVPEYTPAIKIIKKTKNIDN